MDLAVGHEGRAGHHNTGHRLLLGIYRPPAAPDGNPDGARLRQTQAKPWPMGRGFQADIPKNQNRAHEMNTLYRNPRLARAASELISPGRLSRFARRLCAALGTALGNSQAV